jgi:O-antigen ligase
VIPTVQNELARENRSSLAMAVSMPYPPAYLEYLWYIHLVYSMLGQVWGLVIPAVDGVIWLFIAGACLLNMGSRAYKPVVWGLCTAVLTIAIQVLFSAPAAPVARTEIVELCSWIAALITVQALSLRPGFLHRFALVACGIGLACVPYIQVRVVDGVMRAWATGTQIATPNVLGMWFGFCTIYFVFSGLHCATSRILRLASWGAAIACFFILLIAVSRGPLGVALACIVGLRSTLKDSFIPLLGFVLLAWLVYATGVFDDWLNYYFVRAAEQSGRERLFPIAMERILDSPWIGVGLADVAIRNSVGKFINPHNGLLHIALGAGIFPMLCFVRYLVQSITGALRILWKEHSSGETALVPPLVMFALVEIMILDFSFMSPWVVVAFSLASTQQGSVYSRERLRKQGNDYTR